MGQFLNDNPTIVIALGVFLVFVVIGFIGDRYLRSIGKIESLIPSNKQNNDSENADEVEVKTEDKMEASEELMSSDNINEIESNSEINASSQDLSQEGYPPENNIIEDVNKPQVFDSNVSSDEGVNNTF